MATTNGESSRLGRAALRYAKKGRLILPVPWSGPEGCSCGDPACDRPGKHPLISGGLNAASCDPDTIRQWWGKWPDANIGLCTGTGFVVIGVDGPEAKPAPHTGVKGDGGHIVAPLPAAPAPAPDDLADSLSTAEVLDILGPSNTDDVARRARTAAPVDGTPSAERLTPLIICASDLADRPELLVAPVAVIPGLAWAGRVTLFAGREKSGKSTLLSAGVAALSHGKPFLGEPTTLGRVLYWSADREALADQLARLRRFNAELANIDLVQRPPVNLEEVELNLNGHPVLVVDTLASASPEVSNVNSSAEWIPLLLRYVEMARRTGCAVALVYHANRATGKYRDSTALGATVDVIVEMAPGAHPDTRELATVARWPTDAKRAFRLAGTADNAWVEVVGTLRPQLDARLIVAVEEKPGRAAPEYETMLKARHQEVLASLRRLEADGALRNAGSRSRPAWHRVPGPTVPAVPNGSGNLSSVQAGSGSLPFRGEPDRTAAEPDGHTTAHGNRSGDPPVCSKHGTDGMTWTPEGFRCDECARAVSGAGV